jgi:nucleoside 2-deoxyribosyltransferase
MRVYFAGPLFTPYERGFIDECAAKLRAADIDVFVPHEQELATPDATPGPIFAVDYEGIAGANALVALLDGPVIDDGTACEIGIFYGLMQHDATKKGVVGLVTDLRSERTQGRNEGYGLNLFVVGCIEAAGEICTSIDDVLRVLDGWRA